MNTKGHARGKASKERMEQAFFDMARSLGFTPDVPRNVCVCGEYQDFYKACFAGHIPVSAFSLTAEEPFSGRIAEFTEKYQFYSAERINYHVEFFRAGITAIFRVWLNHGCIEPPEEMAGIVFDEYQVERHDMEIKVL